MGDSQNATLPDSQNHHHVATGATAVSQPEVIRRGSDRLIVVKERQPTLNGERMLQVRLPRGDERCAYAPWWSASGDLTARTIQARPAQGTPWWSASGVAPSTGFTSQPGAQVPTLKGARARPEGGARVAAATDFLAHKGPPSEVPAHGQRGGESSSSYRFHGESPRRVIKPLTPQGFNDTEGPPSPGISHKATPLWHWPAHRHASGPFTQTREVRR